MGDHYDPYQRNARMPYDHRDRHDPYREPQPAAYHNYYGQQRRSPSPRYAPRAGDRRDDRYDGGGYSFRGAADRDHYGRSDTRETFSFRAAAPSAPRFPSPDRRPQPQRQDPRRNTDRRGQTKNGPAGRRDFRSQGGRGRGGFTRRKPHTRDILTNVHGGSTPEQLHGMNGDGQAHFMAMESSSEDEGEEEAVIDLTKSSEDDDRGDRASKRVKRETVREATVSKWSNPDPYTSLPPPESLGAPKKDIVKAIRKAKIESAPKVDSANAVKDNVDFISFNFDAGSEDGQVSDASEAEIQYAPPPSNAPSAPATMRPWELPQHELPSNGFHAFNQSLPSVRTRSQTSASRDMDMMDYPPPPPPPGLHVPTNEDIDVVLASQNKGKKRKFDQQSKAVGDLLPEWRVGVNDDPAPWCTVDHSLAANSDLRQVCPTQSSESARNDSRRLHMEICDFFEFVRPYSYEEAVRRDLIARVQAAIRNMHGMDGARNVEIRCFGSFAAGLYLPTADMDLVAVTPGYLRNGIKTFCQTRSKMHKLAAYLENVGIAAPGSVSPVTKAKVPIVKFIDRLSGIKVDISYENDTGLIANGTFQQWKQENAAMPRLVVLIKQLLAMRGLNEVFTGGLGGFSIICMVVSMLQMRHAPHSDVTDYGELLLEFLDLYGNRFDIVRTGLLMKPPSYYDKIRHPMPKQNANNLTIIDPNNPNNDISGGSRCINIILDVFRSAHAALQRRLGQVHSGSYAEGSVLECILGGNYESFIHQRNKLSLLHRGRPVSPPPQFVSKLPPKPALPAKPVNAAGRPMLPAKPPKGQAASSKQPSNTSARSTVIESDQKGAPAAPAPSKKKKKKKAKQTTNDAARRDRARAFAEQHPEVTDVPKKLTKGAAKRLRKQIHGT